MTREATIYLRLIQLENTLNHRIDRALRKVKEAEDNDD